MCNEVLQLKLVPRIVNREQSMLALVEGLLIQLPNVFLLVPFMNINYFDLDELLQSCHFDSVVNPFK